MSNRVTEADLKEWTGYIQRGALERWLKENGIPYRFGRDGKIITTQAAIDHALIDGPAKEIRFA